MRYLLLALSTAMTLTIVACNTGETPHPIEAHFTEWREVTDGPQLVGQDTLRTFMLLCRATRPGEMEQAAKAKYGDHALRYTQTYANPIAWSAIEGDKPRRFATRSVIVKDKLESDGPFATETKGPAGTGVMIKRESGYAPDNGDWQYLYFEPGDKPVVEFDAARKLPSLQHCAACHNQAAKQGYVFMPYLAKRAAVK